MKNKSLCLSLLSMLNLGYISFHYLLIITSKVIDIDMKNKKEALNESWQGDTIRYYFHLIILN